MSWLFSLTVFLVLESPVSPADEWRFPYSKEHAYIGYCVSKEYWEKAFEWRFFLTREWIEDAWWCFRCWDELDNVKRIASDSASKVHYLKKLKRLLPETMWRNGEMPPFVPYWHFVPDR